MSGTIHPSLRAYVECFLSAPFPKQFPRGGGIWDQDPILMRDFRVIMKFEREWKQAQDQMESMQQGSSAIGPSSVGNQGGMGIEGALDQYVKELEAEDN